MTNPRIEKIDADIAKTKKKILQYQSKLRTLERQRIIEEDAEIVAFYRREIKGDHNLAELFRQRTAVLPAESGTDEDISEKRGSDI